MKRRVFLCLTAVLILSMFRAGNLAAQLESPTSMATAGRFSSDVDDFMDVNYYGDVEFKYWFGYASYAFDRQGHLGFASKFGPVYAGLYAGGTLFTGYASVDYVEMSHELPLSSPADPLTPYIKKTYKTFNSFPDVENSENENTFSVLIGVADMGFKLSYYSDYDKFKEVDVARGNISLGGPYSWYSEYKVSNGSINPSILWGMANPILADGIQPYLGFGVEIYKDFRRFKRFQENDPGTDYETRPETIDHSSNFLVYEVSLGLGGYTFYTGEICSLTLDLDYGFAIMSFRNDYNYWDYSADTTYDPEMGTGTNPDLWVFRTGTGFKGTYDGDFTGISAQFHTVSPSFKFSLDGMGRLALKGKLAMNMDFISANISEMGPRSDAVKNDTLVKQGTDLSIFAVNLYPSLAIGLQYQAIPGKLTLNAGGVISGFGFAQINTQADNYVDDKRPANNETRKRKEKYYGALDYNLEDYTDSSTIYTPSFASSYFSIGFKFNFNEKIAVETMTGVKAENEFKLFDNLSTFGQILLSFKF